MSRLVRSYVPGQLALVEGHGVASNSIRQDRDI